MTRVWRPLDGGQSQTGRTRGRGFSSVWRPLDGGQSQTMGDGLSYRLSVWRPLDGGNPKPAPRTSARHIVYSVRTFILRALTFAGLVSISHTASEEIQGKRKQLLGSDYLCLFAAQPYRNLRTPHPSLSPFEAERVFAL